MNTFKTFGSNGIAATSFSGQAKIGEMNFAFIDMGQGDCIIISDPNNKVIVIDCGTASGSETEHFDEAKKIVRAWAGKNSVDLVMTHPDFDHYNRFLELLVYDEPVVDVNCIYFSRSYSEESPLGRYNVDALNRNMHKLGFPVLCEVSLNVDESITKEWRNTKEGKYYTKSKREEIDPAGYVLADGTTKNKQAWSITIIAGNVRTEASPTSATANNVVSLCTMVKLGNSKALLTGDSTEETLVYLYDYQRSHFQNCTIFQIPHHGSESSIPTDDFKNYVNPETLIVSVGFPSYVHNHPRSEIIKKWLTCSRLRKVDMIYDEWVYGVKGYKKFADLKAIKENQWKGYKIEETNTFVRLSDPDDGVKSGTGFWAFTRDFYFLYRRSVDKELFSTGIYGNLTTQSF